MKKVILLVVSILIIVSIVFGVKTAFKNAKEAEEQKTKLISSAVYLPNGEFSEENEGKVIIIPGTIELTEPFVDPLTNVVLPGICANREVEQYEAKPKVNTDDETVFTWKNLGVKSESNLLEEKSCFLFAKCKIGDFDLDSSMLKAISPSKRYTNFSSKAVAEKGYTGNNPSIIKIQDDPYYITRIAEKKWIKGYGNYDSVIRISYKVMEADEPLEYTFVGRQENGKLVEQEYLKTSYKGILTLDEVKKEVTQ